MNQILSTDMPMKNKKTKKTVDIANIIKIFAVLMVILGIFIVGIGVYSIVNGQLEKQEENIEPTISIENKTDTTILLKVTHKKNIASL